MAKQNVLCELRSTFPSKRKLDNAHNVTCAIKSMTQTPNDAENLASLARQVIQDNQDVFAQIPHIEELPQDIYCRIKLKDETKTMATKSYSTPRKYGDTWDSLIRQHLEAGRIRPSNSAHESPAFLVPKSDPNALPRWINDYRILNSNTVTDSHPLPRIDDILAHCGKGSIWSKMDMTNSFFQTRVHPDDIHLTAVTTPRGLFELVAMPILNYR
jgi:hypothetical protein